jgi:hypothetical protein
LHVLWRAQREVPKNVVQLRVQHKALRAGMSGSSSAAPTKVGRLFGVL